MARDRKNKAKPAPPKPRNPEARALRTGAFKPKVEQGRDTYQRKPKHPKQPPVEDSD